LYFYYAGGAGGFGEVFGGGVGEGKRGKGVKRGGMLLRL